VGEAELVAQFDEETARHAATEHGTEHLDRGIVRVRNGRSHEAYEDLRLLRRALEDPAPAGGSDRRGGRAERLLERRHGTCGWQGRQRRKELLNGTDDAGRWNMTTHREDETVRLIDVSVVGNEILA